MSVLMSWVDQYDTLAFIYCKADNQVHALLCETSLIVYVPILVCESIGSIRWAHEVSWVKKNTLSFASVGSVLLYPKARSFVFGAVFERISHSDTLSLCSHFLFCVFDGMEVSYDVHSTETYSV